MNLAHDLLGVGVDAESFSVLQVCLRGLLIFLCALIMVRIGAKRFLGRKTAFDIILMFVLGSMLARPINGSAPLLGSIAVGFLLVLLHRLIAALAVRFHGFGRLVKGTDAVIISDGQIQTDVLHRHHLSQGDLMEDLRLHSVANFADVKEARLERSGELSVVAKHS